MHMIKGRSKETNFDDEPFKTKIFNLIERNVQQFYEFNP